ncbi:cytochrome P450 [Tamaricihabitans halophyticus]|uniref:Cytochrome P450 n=2 Tax=Tamaricihabitans halophyticus TaxID=1262583 RepID=A0A4R2QLE7_9PSEU|nr:cytochrome P450 [Tamaricihabitans halophyticus]
MFDHHTAEFAADPWGVYRDLRERCPVAHSTAYEDGFWVLSRYADIRRCALDTETFSSEGGDLLIPAENPDRLLPVQADPPLATAYRKVIMPLFTASAVRAMRPDIERYTDETIDEFIERGECDLVADLALAVPGKVTMRLVGWPETDWPDVVLPIRDFSTYPADAPERLAAAEQLAGIRQRARDNIRQRATEPDTDVASMLVRGTVPHGTGSRALTEDEAVDIMMMVLFGGVDTTVAAIGNMLLYLETDPRLRARLGAEPELIPGAVDELLRYEAPVQGFARFVRADTEIGERVVATGDKVFLAWAAANRDPAVFDEPDTVRPERSPNPHLAFGIGAHRCIGATLAKVELEVVLRKALARLGEYTVRHTAVRPTPSCGTTFGRQRIPARFVPGPRSRATDNVR